MHNVFVCFNVFNGGYRAGEVRWQERGKTYEKYRRHRRHRRHRRYSKYGERSARIQGKAITCTDSDKAIIPVVATCIAAYSAHITWHGPRILRWQDMRGRIACNAN